MNEKNHGKNFKMVSLLEMSYGSTLILDSISQITFKSQDKTCMNNYFSQDKLCDSKKLIKLISDIEPCMVAISFRSSDHRSVNRNIRILPMRISIINISHNDINFPFTVVFNIMRGNNICMERKNVSVRFFDEHNNIINVNSIILYCDGTFKCKIRNEINVPFYIEISSTKDILKCVSGFIHSNVAGSRKRKADCIDNTENNVESAEDNVNSNVDSIESNIDSIESNIDRTNNNSSSKSDDQVNEQKVIDLTTLNTKKQPVLLQSNNEIISLNIVVKRSLIDHLFELVSRREILIISTPEKEQIIADSCNFYDNLSIMIVCQNLIFNGTNIGSLILKDEKIIGLYTIDCKLKFPTNFNDPNVKDDIERLTNVTLKNPIFMDKIYYNHQIHKIMVRIKNGVASKTPIVTNMILLPSCEQII